MVNHIFSRSLKEESKLIAHGFGNLLRLPVKAKCDPTFSDGDEEHWLCLLHSTSLGDDI